MKRFDVVALGELLIDFTQNGLSGQGNMMMEANPGGAPCNVLAMLQKLGKKTAFVGKVGDDFLGKMLAGVVADAGINTDNLKLTGMYIQHLRLCIPTRTETETFHFTGIRGRISC